MRSQLPSKRTELLLQKVTRGKKWTADDVCFLSTDSIALWTERLCTLTKEQLSRVQDQLVHAIDSAAQRCKDDPEELRQSTERIQQQLEACSREMAQLEEQRPVLVIAEGLSPLGLAEPRQLPSIVCDGCRRRFSVYVDREYEQKVRRREDFMKWQEAILARVKAELQLKHGRMEPHTASWIS